MVLERIFPPLSKGIRRKDQSSYLSYSSLNNINSIKYFISLISLLVLFWCGAIAVNYHIQVDLVSELLCTFLVKCHNILSCALDIMYKIIYVKLLNVFVRLHLINNHRWAVLKYFVLKYMYL